MGLRRKRNPRIKVAIYLEAEQKRLLEILSKKTGYAWSEYIREGVDMVLKKYKRYQERR